MVLACVIMLETHHHHGRHLHEREVNGNCAIASTTTEGEPSNWQSVQELAHNTEKQRAAGSLEQPVQKSLL
ncbi:hypothetical protein KIN20_029926 [Parelaphostrongylus tenuis]|uniref:Uncharacterized protein n=1 Tax=Parelaphostrongylus tenuis TaxID=148309 RepID=A0AAD5WGF8_PARTN|nr:hypothetical protein KIN20_029926 [Parelaphostrongylus tenuis]